MKELMLYIFMIVVMSMSAVRVYERRHDFCTLIVAAIIAGVYGIFTDTFSDLIFSIVSAIVILSAYMYTLWCKQQLYADTVDSARVFHHNQEEHFLELQKKYDAIQRANAQREKQFHEIRAVYEGTIELSGAIDINSKIALFVKMLRAIASFAKGELLTIEETKEGLQLTKIYTFNTEIHEYSPETVKRGKQRNRIHDIIKRISHQYTPFIFYSLGVKETIFPITRSGQLFAIVVLSELAGKNHAFFLPILLVQMALEMEKANLYEKVRKLSITDGVTGLYVRTFFRERLEQEISRAHGSARDVAFLIIDIDHFKRCNDRYGHLVGDMVLKHIADILHHNAREIDLLGRYAGDEFVIALPKICLEEALAVGERIRASVAQAQLAVYGRHIAVTVSVGVALVSQCAHDSQQLIDAADAALYRAKSLGRNKVCGPEGI